MVYLGTGHVEERDVEFISTFENYKNEECGDKSNTIRSLKKMHPNRLNKILAATHVRIRKGYTKEFFRRKISNITVWRDDVIISWRHNG